MHGNEVENSRGYRFRLVSSLPHLKSLDFSALTLIEKDKAKTCKIVTLSRFAALSVSLT